MFGPVSSSFNMSTLFKSTLFFFIVLFVESHPRKSDIWNDIPCYKDYMPEKCEPANIDLQTVDDYDLCGPAYLPSRFIRNYYIAAAGRRITYQDNKDAYDRIKIKQRDLRDVSNIHFSTTVLGQQVDFPIGFAPTALHKLANPAGELATLSAVLHNRTVMILSSYASTSIEDIGKLAKYGNTHLWMQTYIFRNRSMTANVVRRAKKNGFKAIVVSVDSPVNGMNTCNAKTKFVLPEGVRFENVDLRAGFDEVLDPSITFRSISWLKRVAKLPIVAKGILTGDDAKRAFSAGASAVIVSNHGGRQLDGVPATIDALPGVVSAASNAFPRGEVYVDGGVRSGSDVYKALARGAKMVFIGRPVIWGLALGGEQGVRNTVDILVKQLNNTMMLTGSPSLDKIEIY